MDLGIHGRELGRLAQRKQIQTYIGGRIRAAREAAGISQADLGDVLGVSFVQVQKYETGTNPISAAMLCQMAAVLNLNVSFFFEGAPTLDLN